jgi:hypothetical protein
VQCATSSYDIVLLIDQSGSVTQPEYELLSGATVDLVSKVSNYLSSGTTGFQFGVVAFATESQEILPLSSDQNAINLAVQQRIYSSNTNIGTGFTVAYQTSIGLNTRNVNKKIILYTDGNNNFIPDTSFSESENIKNSIYNSIYRTEIICVGIGNSIDYNNLYSYASDPQYVFSATTFDDIDDINASIVNAICQPLITPTPTPSSTPLSTIYISTVLSTCSDFCTMSYTYNSAVLSTSSYLGIGVGDTISGITVSGFYAIGQSLGTTPTGTFKIVETDANGIVQSVNICSGGSCVPL